MCVCKSTTLRKAGQRLSTTVSAVVSSLVRWALTWRTDLNPEWDQIIYIPGKPHCIRRWSAGADLFFSAFIERGASRMPVKDLPRWLITVFAEDDAGVHGLSASYEGMVFYYGLKLFRLTLFAGPLPWICRAPPHRPGSSRRRKQLVCFDGQEGRRRLHPT